MTGRVRSLVSRSTPGHYTDRESVSGWAMLTAVDPRISSPFDAAAASYDADFSDTVAGRTMRGLVWERLEGLFTEGQRLVELGCGTGEDAVWLAGRGVRVAATDRSSAMLERASAKADRARVADRISFSFLDLDAIDTADAPEATPFDGALANFGVLNCLADRRPLARRLAEWLRPGAVVVVVVMGRWCLPELLGFAVQLEPRRALRRLRDGRQVGTGGGGTVATWYPGWRLLRREFGEHFVVRERRAVGLAVPPPDFEDWLKERPERVAGLLRWERRLAPLFPGLGDHTMLVLERRS